MCFCSLEQAREPASRFRQANMVVRSHIHHIAAVTENLAPRPSVEEPKAVLAKPALCVGEAIEVEYALTYGRRLNYRASRDSCRMLQACRS